MDAVFSALKPLEPWIVAFIPEPSALPGILWSLLQYSLWFALAYVAIRAVHRLPMVLEIVRGFISARGPIWDFRSTIEDFRSSTTELKKLEPIIATLREQMALLDDKIDAAQKQLVELQRHSASERTDDPEPSSPTPPLPGTTAANGTAATATEDQENWLKLREIWRAHINRLEALIDDIDDGRKARAYRNMTRYDYKPIIDRLQSDGKLTDELARASKKLMDIFNAYRPRNRRVPDKLIGELVMLDQQLASEMKLPAVTDDGNTATHTSANPAPPIVIVSGNIKPVETPPAVR